MWYRNLSPNNPDDVGNVIVSTVRNVGSNDDIGGGGGSDNFAHMRALFTLIAKLKE